jgi:hypothetical protein
MDYKIIADKTLNLRLKYFDIKFAIIKKRIIFVP